MTKEVLILHEANSKMKEQLRDLKSQVNGDSTIDKLMAQDPVLASELKSVALLQRQVIILKKSNNSLRTQKSIKFAKFMQQMEDLTIENELLKHNLGLKENELKLLLIKLKEVTRGSNALAVSEKQFLDVQAMI